MRAYNHTAAETLKNADNLRRLSLLSSRRPARTFERRFAEIPVAFATWAWVHLPRFQKMIEHFSLRHLAGRHLCGLVSLHEYA